MLPNFLGFGSAFGKVEWGSREVRRVQPASHSLSPANPQDKDSPNLAVGAQAEAIFGDELSGVLLGDISAMGRRPERNGAFFSSAYMFPK